MAIASSALTSDKLTKENTNSTSVAAPTTMEESRRAKVSSITRPTSCIGPISEATKTEEATPSPFDCSRFTTCTEIADVMNADNANDVDKYANIPVDRIG